MSGGTSSPIAATAASAVPPSQVTDGALYRVTDGVTTELAPGELTPAR